MVRWNELPVRVVCCLGEAQTAVQSTAAPVSHALYPSHEKSSPIYSWTTQDIDAWLDKHNIRHLASVYVNSSMYSYFVQPTAIAVSLWRSSLLDIKVAEHRLPVPNLSERVVIFGCSSTYLDTQFGTAAIYYRSDRVICN